MRTKMLFILSLLSFQKAFAKPRCGGIYTDARGVIQTPGFPGPFQTPIDCEWVIDAQHMLPKNTTIVVYLTQLFVFEGLKFTEYQVYDDGFQFNGRDLLVVNESTVVSERTVETNQSYLVISLKLASMEGTHLRVLDHLLDVFGFNVTYEIVDGQARPDRCNMMDCGFNGNCLDDYTTFRCACYANFTGSHCSEGPQSLCRDNKGPYCQNGGTCRHVGAATAKCLCPPGFEGDRCEVPAGSSGAGDTGVAEGELVSCQFSGKQRDVCNCPVGNNQTGFLVSMHLGNLPKLKDVELEGYIRDQIMQNLKSEIPKLKNIVIEEIRLNAGEADVGVRVYCQKKDEEALKSVFTRWSARRFIGNLTVLDEDMNSGPILSTASLSVNKPGTIRIHEDFVLSCEARGSSAMTFRWMKDGIFIKTSHSGGRKWNRIIKDPHVEGQYTALLGVTEADALDAGVFTCQVEDFGFQRCMSKRIHIRRPPLIRMDPMSLTVRKGERFAVKCICAEDNSPSRRIYSWTKNRELLPVRTDWLSYEVLYPDGSILEVHKAEKSATYSCLVQDGSISAEASVEVLVVTNTGMKTCLEEENFRVRWPETASDSESKQPCPEDFTGTASRKCTLTTEGATWRTPDFSQCTFRDLLKVFDEFKAYSLGYETSYGPAETMSAILSRLHGPPLLPAEGARLLTLLRKVISIISSSRFDLTDEGQILFDIIDGIMNQKEALIDGSQVELLQRVVKEMALFYFSLRVNGTLSAFHRSSETVDVSLAAVDEVKSPFLKVPLAGKSYPKWFPYKLEVNIELGDCTPVLASVVYRNLSSFLPRRSAIRLEDGTEIEYELSSDVLAVWLFDAVNNVELKPLRGVTASMEFKNRPRNTSSEHWETRCAVADFAMFENSWDISSCSTEELNETYTRCFCTKTGTYAVILANKPHKSFSDKLEIHRFVVTLGCTICFVLSTASGVVLLAQWSHNRTCLLFVKLQCCFSISGAMIVFIVALATENNHSASSAMCLMVLLETFLLLAASTQLSKLLVVYAEFVQFPRPGKAKMTLVGVVTGVPLITVFGNHTAHKTMNIKLKTWWIVTNSLSFYVFMTCFVIIILLYIFVYVVIESKLHQLSKFHQKNLGCLQQRMYLLSRSALIFGFLITTTLSSIAYVNHSSQIYWNYEFCVITVSLGLVIVFSYVLKKDNTSYPDILEKLKTKDREMIIANSKNDHLTFYTKEEPEAESESTPESKYTPKTTKVRFAPEPQLDLIEHPPEVTAFDVLENYRCSPKSFRKGSSVRNRDLQEADCLELDLVISFKQEEQKKVNLVKPRIAVTACDEDVAASRGGKMEFTTFQKNAEVKSEKVEGRSDLDVVLTSISQDLDYLLNQEEDLMDTLKRKRLKSVRNVEDQDLSDRKYPEAIADISRTKC